MYEPIDNKKNNLLGSRIVKFRSDPPIAMEPEGDAQTAYIISPTEL